MPAQSYAQSAALGHLTAMPDGLKLGQLAKGGFGSIVQNVFRNMATVTNTGYNRDDAQIITGAEAYFGRPEVIRDTMLVMTVTERAWLTQRLSPIQIMPETAKVLTWNVTRFKASMATQVPHLGVPRIARSERIKVTAAMKRTGKGYAMEHDFMNTREGLRYHLAQLEQVANAMRDAIYYDILYTVTDAQRWEKDYVRSKKLHADKTVDQYFRDQIWTFGILQKSLNAWPKMDAQIDDTMAYWGGVSDVYIIPPQVIRYVNLVPRENTSFMEAGPAGPQRLYDSTKPFATAGAVDVFVARSYLSDEMMGARQLLEDDREFGEWYRMLAPEFDPDVPYRSKQCHIMIYSFPRDQMVELTLRFALDNSFLFDKSTGEPLYLNDPSFQYKNAGTTPQASNRDIFRFKKADGNYGDARFFGEIEPRYFTIEDKLNLARSVVGALETHFTKSVCSSLLCDFNDGLLLLRRIQNIGGTDTNLTEIARLARAADIGPSQRANSDLSPTIGLQEYNQDPTTGFIRTNPGPPAYVLDQLLPGLQSEAGFRFLVRHAGAGLQAERAIASRFLAAVQQIARFLENYFPDNLAMSGRFASAIWQFPTATTAFVDNMLVGSHNPPLFIRLGINAGAALASLAATLSNIVAGWPPELQFDVVRTIARFGAANAEQQGDYLFIMVALIQSVMRLANVTNNFATFRGVFTYNDVAEVVADAAAGIVGVPAHRVLAIPNTANAAADANEFIANTLLSSAFAAEFNQFNTEGTRANLINTIIRRARELRRDAGAGQAGAFYRSPFLVSRALAQSLLDSSAVAPDVRAQFMVGNLAFPDVPTSPASAEPGIIGHELPFAANPMVVSVLSMHLATSMDGQQQQVGQYFGEAAAYDYPMQPASARAAERFRQTLDPNAVPAENLVTVLSETARRAMEAGERFWSPNLSSSWAAIDAYTPDAFLQAIMHIYDTTPIHRRALYQWIANNIRLPIDFVVTRPHIFLSQLNIVKMKAGSDTMITGIAPGQFEVADDATTQAHSGTITAKHGILMMKPENVYNWKGAMVNGVHAGLGLMPINPEDYNCGFGEFPNQDVIVLAVSPRDDFGGNILSLTGDLTLDETRVMSLHLDGYQQYETSARYNQVYGFREGRAGISTEETTVASLADRYSNVVCLPGPYVSVDPRSGEFKYAHQGQSFLSGLIYPHCGDLLSGKMTERHPDAWKGFVVV